MPRPRVLVTGFGPFPGAPENPSASLADALGATQWPGCELHAQILPTEWEAVAALVPLLYARLQPDVMIHFGLCQRAVGFRIERSAYNRAAPRADARAALPAVRHVVAQGPERLDTRVPAAKVAAHLSDHGLPAASSRSAGRYLCNFLYYHSLAWAATQQAAPVALFVHIPKAAGQGGLFSDAALLHGAQEVIRFVLAFAKQRKPEIQIGTPAAAAPAPNALLLDAKEAP
jgi:pyroglutamyl-peptidase